MSQITVDTGVLAEYANVKGSLHLQAKALFHRINQGGLTAVVVPPTIAELYYVMARLYEEDRRKSPTIQAAEYCRYIFYHSGVFMEELGLDLLLGAGKVKEQYSLALTDCFVLASAKIRGCKAVFRHREKEIEEAEESLFREFSIIFLEDYA